MQTIWSAAQSQSKMTFLATICRMLFSNNIKTIIIIIIISYIYIAPFTNPKSLYIQQPSREFNHGTAETAGHPTKNLGHASNPSDCLIDGLLIIQAIN